MGANPNFPTTPRSQHTILIPGFGTRPRAIWTPGADGSEVRQINVASSDTANNNVQLFVGKPLSLASNMGAANFVDNGVSADQITRNAGSFVTDGWRAGERLLAQGATTVGNDFDVILTAVSALAVDLATGGGTVAAAEALAADTKLYRLLKLFYNSVPLGSGAPSVVSVSGLNTTQAPMLDGSPDRMLLLGADDVLFAAATTALGSGETMDIAVFGWDY